MSDCNTPIFRPPYALMKTTIEISDNLFERAKRHAARHGTTLRALVEEGLSAVLREGARRPPYRLRDASYGRGGLTDAARVAGWEAVRDWANERGAGPNGARG